MLQFKVVHTGTHIRPFAVALNRRAFHRTQPHKGQLKMNKLTRNGTATIDTSPSGAGNAALNTSPISRLFREKLAKRKHEANRRAEVDWGKVHQNLHDLREWHASSDDLRSRISLQALRMLTDAIDFELTEEEIISRALRSMIRSANAMNRSDDAPKDDQWRLMVATMLAYPDLETFAEELEFYRIAADACRAAQ
jgi:hypothetical protein